MSGDLPVIEVRAKIRNTIFSGNGGGKVTKPAAHLPRGQSGFDAHAGRSNIVIGEPHKSSPPLCCSEASLCAGPALNEVVEFLGDPSDVLLAADDHLLNCDQRTTAETDPGNSKIIPREIPDDVSWDHVTWDYSERLVIDSAAQTLEHIAHIGTGCHVSDKIEIEEGVNALLENFEADSFFRHTVGNPDDVIETPDETKDYIITIDYKKSPQRIINGSFDKKGLPDDFAVFAEIVCEFIQFYNAGEMFNPSIYGKAKRRSKEYIFCSVEFDGGNKSYYYITDDDSIEIGDYVVVPAGKDDHHAVVEVVNIEYFTEDDAPLPLNKTKRIIRKCTDDDFPPPEVV